MAASQDSASHINIQPCSKKAPSPPPNLDTLAPELREKIYGYIIDDEQAPDRTWAGLASDPGKLCLPLTNLRPPALIRVNRVLREEYLHYFFRHTLFRVNARIPVHTREIVEWLPGRTTGIVGDFAEKAGKGKHQLPRLMDASASAWLRSIQSIESLKLRHVQYRPVSIEGEPLGLTLNIEYHPGKGYFLQRVIDDGWLVSIALAVYDEQAGGDRLHGTFLVMLFLQDRCWENGPEALRLDAVLELEMLFRRYGLGQKLRQSTNPLGHSYATRYPWSALHDWSYWTAPPPRNSVYGVERLTDYLGARLTCL